ncbi:hypothetical protein [Ligilactobacillus faecis]|uniref:hypothetical protein n=1 Tax=Ligilactobacillus faecis TaxID=762833 RepID=UPI0024690620|nr:hypothetical protein [Ligilactobacillus faecis]WGN89559.1 hypothetical protein QFX10_00165 [Ligilactobacillus faecis]
MQSKKLLVTSLLVFLLSPVVTPTVQTVKASTDTTTAVTVPVKESDYNSLKEQRSIWTKIAKAALKKAIQNRSAVINAVRSVSGRTVANQVDRYYGAIVNALKPLLEWSEVPAQAVYDAVYRSVRSAGASNSVATNIALAIREAVSWIL